MDMLSLDQLVRYWVGQQWQANVLMLMHLAGAMALGMVLGYERAYHGRAAGMRTYALVCMASTGLVIILSYPAQWFGGHAPASVVPAFADPTRVIQGVVTGIGFLCAGVIMKEGMNISGLTTAASMWSACSIGVLLGMGFYFAAIALTIMCASMMMWGARLENTLPSHPAIAVTIRCDASRTFDTAVLKAFASQHGFFFAAGSLSVERTKDYEEWRFVCAAKKNWGPQTLTRYASHLKELEGVTEYKVTHARN